MDWSNVDDAELLRAYCSLMSALKQRGIVRSSNNPVADYTEKLVSDALGLTLSSKSNAGFDAKGPDGLRYQIKGRRLTAHNKSTQLGALRNLAHAPFDVLAAVIYTELLEVEYAGLVPIDVVIEKSRFSSHSNCHVFLFRRSVLDDSQVTDITDLVRKT